MYQKLITAFKIPIPRNMQGKRSLSSKILQIVAPAHLHKPMQELTYTRYAKPD